jgi:hypothetical protein
MVAKKKRKGRAKAKSRRASSRRIKCARGTQKSEVVPLVSAYARGISQMTSRVPKALRSVLKKQLEVTWCDDAKTGENIVRKVRVVKGRRLTSTRTHALSRGEMKHRLHGLGRGSGLGSGLGQPFQPPPPPPPPPPVAY